MTKEQILMNATKKEQITGLAKDTVFMICQRVEGVTEDDVVDVAHAILQLVNRPVPPASQYTGIRDVNEFIGINPTARSTSAIMCNHANESPVFCDCSDDCYCKTRTCKNKSVRPRQKPIDILEFGGQSRER